MDDAISSSSGGSGGLVRLFLLPFYLMAWMLKFMLKIVGVMLAFISGF